MKLYFDNYDKHDQPHTVEVTEDSRLTVKQGENVLMTVACDIDQWGTFVSIIADEGFTIAQEADTRGFLTALIAGLTELRDKHCHPTTSPTETAGE